MTLALTCALCLAGGGADLATITSFDGAALASGLDLGASGLARPAALDTSLGDPSTGWAQHGGHDRDADGSSDHHGGAWMGTTMIVVMVAMMATVGVVMMSRSARASAPAAPAGPAARAIPVSAAGGTFASGG